MSNHPRAAVIGYPIAHSLSPDIFNFLSRQMKQPLRYLKCKVSPENLNEVLNLQLRSNCVGLNITLPYKQKVLKWTSRLSEEAEALRAVNVLQNTQKGWIGHNTDIFGISQVFRKKRINIKDKRVLVFGAGGAARALCWVLGKKGAQEVEIINRSEKSAKSLCSEMNRSFPKTQFIASRKVDLIKKYYLVVNATPQGMRRYPVLIYPSLQIPSQFAFDMVYRPLVTDFLKSAKKAGAIPIGGLEMLVWQALATWEIWFGPMKQSFKFKLKKDELADRLVRYLVRGRK